MLISVIITTYNWPEALQQTLLSLKAQSDLNFEVIIADDGSTKATESMLSEIKPTLNYHLEHVWQDDKGFRAAQIRNKAIAKAKGDYVLFLDQDTPPLKHYIANQRAFVQSGYFTSAQRILINKRLTDNYLAKPLAEPLADKSLLWYFIHYCRRDLNHFLPFFRLPLGPLRYCRKNQWKGTKCLLGVWRADLIAINGFNEQFFGWGYEDSDLVIRLLQHGVKRKLSKYGCATLHLEHQYNFVTNDVLKEKNWQRLQQTIAGDNPAVFPGLSQYL